MAQTKYNFLSDSFSSNFLTYTPVELDFPLNDSPIDISDWATEISPLGIPIVKSTIDTSSSKEEEQETESTQKTRIRVNNTEEVPIINYNQNNGTSTTNYDKGTSKTNQDNNGTSKTSYDNEISFENLLKQEGVHARITSGYRENSKTSSGKTSHHATRGGAYDVVPTDGDFENLRREIYENPRIVAWMKNKGWGILEETNPEIKRRTGATGDHWHFGPDRMAVQQFNQNLS